jgi:murein DD-endopeptidase MepM/ murein hydrolase activator NlpD
LRFAGVAPALALVVGLWGGSGATASPRWYAPPTLVTGKANEVYAWDEGPVGRFTVEVLRPDQPKPAASVPGVAQGALTVGDQLFQWSSALVGLDALEVPGPVTIQIRGADGLVASSFSSQVVAVPYAVEDLPLNQAMTQLRAVPDPRKDREAEAIWKVYLTFHPQGVWSGGRFRLPVDASFPYSAHYGDTRRYLYSDGTTALDVHRGIDFAVPVGTPVSAPAPGAVVLVAARKLTGTTVVLEHAPGVYSIYFHLSKALVKVGQTVAAGDRLALSGATGLVTGPHLHWEVKVNGVSVDALGLVSDGVLDTSAVCGVISSVER